MADTNYIISVENLVKRYKLYRDARQLAADQIGFRKIPFRKWAPIPEFEALHGVTLTLQSGERVGLIGRNGAGKTTLLRLMIGAITPTSGTVEVQGRIQPLMQTGIGFHPEFTGRENIEASLRYLGLTGREFEAAREEVIEWVELGEFLDQPFSTYSLGMQGRTQFAVATAIRPDVLLVDEVLGAGDGYFSAKSAMRMKNLIGKGCSLILVSHSSQTILQFCERVIWLRDGIVHRDGPAPVVVAEYEQEMEMLAGAGAGARAEAVTAIDNFTLPSSLQTKFVDASVARSEPVNAMSPSEQAIVAPDGRRVYRVAGKSGIRIVDVRLASAIERKGGVHVGDGIDVSVSLELEGTAPLDLRVSLLIYSIAGERMARSTAALQEVSGNSARTAMIRAKLAPLILGAANYVLSVLVEDLAEPEFSESARYDLWSRCGALNFAPTNEPDPPRLHLPSQWNFDGSSERVMGRISIVH